MLKIIVGYDFTSLAQLAMEQAAAFGSRFAPVQIHAVCVLDGSMKARGLIEEVDYQNAERIRKELATRLEQVPARHEMLDAEVFAHVRIGKADHEILSLADEVEADMIFVGTHGLEGLSRLFLGSVAESIVRHAHCPVFVARAKEYEKGEARADTQPEPAGASMTHRLEPHVYSYSSRIAPRRPVEWPLY